MIPAHCRRLAGCFLASSFALSLLACSPGAEGPWDLVASADTVVHDYSGGWPSASGSGALLVEVRRFGDSFEGGLGFLAQPIDLAVDDQGHVYVLDFDAHAVVVFDEAGNYLRSFGREGQGPGEFLSPRSIACVGDTLAVYDSARRGFSLHGLDGEYLGDLEGEVERVVSAFDSGDTLVFSEVRTIEVEGTPSYQIAVRSSAIDGPIADVALAYPYRGVLLRPERLGAAFVQGYNGGSAGIRYRRPDFRSGGVGSVIAYPGSAPEIGRLSAGGDWEWIVRMPLPRLPISSDEIERITRPQKRGRQIERDDLILPEHAPVLSHILTDARGNVVAYPARPDGRTDPSEATTAHLFGPDGRYGGTLQTLVRYWHDAWGEFVYSIETHPGSDEPVIIQRRLEL